MKIGLQVTIFTMPGGPAAIRDNFARVVREAEAAGFDSLWVMDHFWQLEGAIGPRNDAMLEGYSALSYAAALTSSIKLGTLVTGVTYRHPGILVKTATTLDVLSGGRAYFGVGAAWYDAEHAGLGIPYPPRKERFEILEDTLQMAHQMWSGEAKPFDGKHLHLAETLNSPNAISKPHPPIMIGGMGEQKTFRLIAKYGDACNIFSWRGPESVAQKYAVLRERCEEIGRDYAEIEKTTLSEMLVTHDGTIPTDTYQMTDPPPASTPQQAVEYFQQLAEVGTDHAIFNTPAIYTSGCLDIWASEIIPTVHQMQPAGR